MPRPSVSPSKILKQDIRLAVRMLLTSVAASFSTGTLHAIKFSLGLVTKNVF
jgi:hypothetical protein